MPIIKLNELAEKIGNHPKEMTLPNGQTRMSVNWDGPTAQKAAMEVYPLASTGEKVVIDGPAPAWFVSALAHTVHPCQVGLYDPKIGVIDIPKLQRGEQNPAGGISFKVTEYENAVKVEWAIDNGTVPPVYDAKDLSNIVVPDIPAGKEVIISGKGPNYINAAIGEAYAHTQKAVSYFQPQTHGYTTGIAHTPELKIGDFRPKEELEKEMVPMVACYSYSDLPCRNIRTGEIVYPMEIQDEHGMDSTVYMLPRHEIGSEENIYVQCNPDGSIAYGDEGHHGLTVVLPVEGNPQTCYIHEFTCEESAVAIYRIQCTMAQIDAGPVSPYLYDSLVLGMDLPNQLDLFLAFQLRSGNNVTDLDGNPVTLEQSTSYDIGDQNHNGIYVAHFPDNQVVFATIHGWINADVRLEPGESAREALPKLYAELANSITTEIDEGRLSFTARAASDLAKLEALEKEDQGDKDVDSIPRMSDFIGGTQQPSFDDQFEQASEMAQENPDLAEESIDADLDDNALDDSRDEDPDDPFDTP